MFNCNLYATVRALDRGDLALKSTFSTDGNIVADNPSKIRITEKGLTALAHLVGLE